jgi:hypothetical protein
MLLKVADFAASLATVTVSAIHGGSTNATVSAFIGGAQ